MCEGATIMSEGSRFTKRLAVVGVVLVWLPIAATLVLSAIGSVATGRFLFDFLMPAELYLLTAIGGLLLVWAAFRAHSHRAVLGGSLAASVALLAGSQGAAVLTGLASGANEPVGWRVVLVLAIYAGFVAAVIVLGIAGVHFVRSIGPTRPEGHADQPAHA